MPKPQRPATFEDGKVYFLLEGIIEKMIQFQPVTFLAYDPCPAMVIVRCKELWFRCCRDYLFNLEKYSK